MGQTGLVDKFYGHPGGRGGVELSFFAFKKKAITTTRVYSVGQGSEIGNFKV